jgi:hypothetical protein
MSSVQGKGKFPWISMVLIIIVKQMSGKRVESMNIKKFDIKPI